MKDRDFLERINERLECELEDYFEKKIEPVPNMTIQDAEIIDLFLHSMKSLKTIMAMDGYDDEEKYSGSRYYPQTGYSGDHNYPIRNNYSGRRDSMGRYSRDSEKEDMMHKLDGMMRNAKSEDEAISIKSAMDALSRLK